MPAAVLLPAISGDDSFPLSTYPMYAFERGRTDRFPAVLAEHVNGDLVPVSSRVVAATRDPLIAESVVTSAINNGTADELCRAVARHMAADVRRVLVVEEVHDVVAAARHRPSLLDRRIHASCAVQR